MSTRRTPRDALRVTLVTAVLVGMMIVGLVPAAHATTLLDGLTGDAEAEGGDGGDGGLGVGVGCVNVLSSCEEVEGGTANGGDGGDAVAVSGGGKPVRVIHVVPVHREVEDKKVVRPRPQEKPKAPARPAPRGGQVRLVPRGGVQTGAGGTADPPAVPPLAVSIILGAAGLAKALAVWRLTGSR